MGYPLRAVQRDVRQSANEEAITYFSRELALLESLPRTPERSQLKFALQSGIGAPLIAAGATACRRWAMPSSCRRRWVIRRGCGERWSIWQYYLARAQHQRALHIAQQMALSGLHEGGLLHFPFPRGARGISVFNLGEFEATSAQLLAVVACYDPEKHRPQRSRWISPDEAVEILRAEHEQGHVHHAFLQGHHAGAFPCHLQLLFLLLRGNAA